jgi:hypothetical protein
MGLHAHARRAGLAVPALELVQPLRQLRVGLASAIACAKSSQVTAWPSWRWKYSVRPLAKPSRPTSVCIMRTTSAPFSYTVTV